jgi:hypothetical protein
MSHPPANTASDAGAAMPAPYRHHHERTPVAVQRDAAL